MLKTCRGMQVHNSTKYAGLVFRFVVCTLKVRDRERWRCRRWQSWIVYYSFRGRQHDWNLQYILHTGLGEEGKVSRFRTTNLTKAVEYWTIPFRSLSLRLSDPRLCRNYRLKNFFFKYKYMNLSVNLSVFTTRSIGSSVSAQKQSISVQSIWRHFKAELLQTMSFNGIKLPLWSGVFLVAEGETDTHKPDWLSFSVISADREICFIIPEQTYCTSLRLRCWIPKLSVMAWRC